MLVGQLVIRLRVQVAAKTNNNNECPNKRKLHKQVESTCGTQDIEGKESAFSLLQKCHCGASE